MWPRLTGANLHDNKQFFIFSFLLPLFKVLESKMEPTISTNLALFYQQPLLFSASGCPVSLWTELPGDQ